MNYNGRDINSGVDTGSADKVKSSNHISPIRPIQRNTIPQQKTANRLFGSVGVRSGFQNIFSIQNNVDPLDVLYDFSSIAKSKRNMQDVYYLLHNIAVTRLGLSFSALGILNSQSNCINLQLLDRIGNSFNSRALLSKSQNPIVKAFVDKIPQTVADNDFLKIDYIPKTKSLILPMFLISSSIELLLK